MIKGFREFIMRGNVIDLAVAFVIGAAFGKVIDAFVKNLVNPVIAAFGSTKGLEDNVWCLKGTCSVVNGSVTGVAIGWGALLSALLTFVITAAVVYFVFVLPLNKAKERAYGQAAAEESELDVLREIREELRGQRESGSAQT